MRNNKKVIALTKFNLMSNGINENNLSFVVGGCGDEDQNQVYWEDMEVIEILIQLEEERMRNIVQQ